MSSRITYVCNYAYADPYLSPIYITTTNQPPPTPQHYLPPIEIQIPTPQKQENKITRAESDHNPQIPPPSIKRNRQRLIKLVSNAISAVRAVRGRVVGDVARAVGGEEGLHVFAAGLAGGRGEEV